MIWGRSFTAVILLLGLGAPMAALANPAPAPTTRVEVQNLPPIAEEKAAPFDAEKAVNAYLGTVKGEARANSDSYFEGGYLLLVVDALYALAVMALLLWGGVSARMRNLAVKATFITAGVTLASLHRMRAPAGLQKTGAVITSPPFWQTPIYALQFVVAVTLLSFPLTVYEGFFREHAYGLSNQNFLEWFGDFGISFVLTLVLSAIGLTALYAAIRRTGKSWWLWATGLFIAFNIVGMIFAPVYIAPLFNTYKAMPPSPLQAQVLSLARANGIPATNVYVFDASKQSKRVSANVSGLMGTTRISLNDNLLNRTSHSETLAVLGHEMGHYVLDHAVRLLLFAALLGGIGFAFADRAFRALTRRYGTTWDVRGIDDVAGFPVLFAIFIFYNFVTTPVQNTVSRTTEAQADIFGLNAARQPDGFSTATLKLSEYRKLDPSPLEEWVFYDHPSGRSRITMAMRWKAEHLNDPDIKAGPKSPQ